jgi:hypothetical protein
MNEAWTDVKIAVRRLRRAPGFAVTVVATLTIAIAANLAVFAQWWRGRWAWRVETAW